MCIPYWEILTKAAGDKSFSRASGCEKGRAPHWFRARFCSCNCFLLSLSDSRPWSQFTLNTGPALGKKGLNVGESYRMVTVVLMGLWGQTRWRWNDCLKIRKLTQLNLIWSINQFAMDMALSNQETWLLPSWETSSLELLVAFFRWRKR